MESQGFGKRIKDLRIKAGLNQRSLADMVGINFTYLSKIENGVMPPPGEEVIIRLAGILNADIDELLTLAGKVPSDIVSQIMTDPGLFKSLRKGKIRKQGKSSMSPGDSFGKRLKELREKAKLSQGELAEKAGISFTYLSKIENGVKPPPSQKVILRLADTLHADADELLASAGRMPSDLISRLTDRETLDALRGSLRDSNKEKTNRAGGIDMLKSLLFRKVTKVAVPIMLVLAVAGTLWFGTPIPTKALQVGIANDPTGYYSLPYMFSLTITIENNEFLPIDSIDLTIQNAASPSYTKDCPALPLTDGGTKSYPDNGVLNATAYAPGMTPTTGAGYVEWKGSGYTFVPAVGYAGPLTITYNMVWTPPVAWPAGLYNIVADVKAPGKTFTQTSTLTLATATMIAETGLTEGLNGSSIAIVNAIINRVKDASGNTVTIPGGVGSYTAQLSVPGGGMEILGVAGVAPFGNIAYNAATGIFSATSSAPAQPNNTIVAQIMVKLTGSNAAYHDLNVAFTDIVAAGDSTSVPVEQLNVRTFRRGDANGDNAITIGDALIIAQYIVGQKTIDELKALNAACISHEVSGGDKLAIGDALFVAQFIVGQKDAFFVEK